MGRAVHGMNEKIFTFSKEDVLTALRKNLTDHKHNYQIAYSDWKDATLVEAEKKMKLLRAGKLSSIYVDLTEPEDHTSDYQDFIDALEMAQETIVELSIREHKRFVKDEWEWKEEFLRMSETYSMMSSST